VERSTPNLLVDQTDKNYKYFSGIILSLSGILVTEFILDYLVLPCLDRGRLFQHLLILCITRQAVFLFQFLHASRRKLLFTEIAYNHSSTVTTAPEAMPCHMHCKYERVRMVARHAHYYNLPRLKSNQKGSCA
jgi:hypothetical protein